MVDHRLEGPGENGTPVPRDLPDQQAHAGEDPWEVAPARAAENAGEDTGSADTDDSSDADADTDDSSDADAKAEAGAKADADADAAPDMDVPDTDEAGTGRQGAPRAATVNPAHPTPDESTG
ncbi:hypothetical protein [Streptomyces bobili]|uniref:hypothetical protein n=1 Tax=Streptomyces bobili TaxID=67280 RepID=UPI000A3CF9F2|nr:hypothetical protein [Streptomyces bobili]